MNNKSILLTGNCNVSYQLSQFNFQSTLIEWNPITPTLFNSRCRLTIHRQSGDTGTLLTQLAVSPEFSSLVLACSATLSIDDGSDNAIPNHPKSRCLLNQALSKSITTTNTSLSFQITFGSVAYRIIQWKKTLFNLNVSYISRFNEIYSKFNNFTN